MAENLVNLPQVLSDSSLNIASESTRLPLDCIVAPIVNLVLTLASEMTTDKNASDEKNQSTLGSLDSVPAKRPGNVKDMARVALFLGSRGSEYLNGQIVAVDGGYLLAFPSAG